MDTFRLKNIIILILILANICLLGSLGIRQISRQSALQEADQQMVDLFQKEGVTLDASVIPDTSPPDGRTLVRSIDLDTKIASYILASSVTFTDKGGGIYTYQSGENFAQFRSNGGFDITCDVSVEAPETFCSEFCRKFGCGDLISTLENGSGSVTVIQYYDRLPVINCSIVFRFEGGVLCSVSGTHIPDTYTDVSDEEPLSALSALSVFLDARRSSGVVMSSVSKVYLCYELQSSTANPMLLTPSWCIVTDTANFYVNCLTGAVSHS